MCGGGLEVVALEAGKEDLVGGDGGGGDEVVER